MIEVKVKNNNLDRAFSILKRQLKENNFFDELKKREYYKKPSQKRREAKRQAKIRVYKREKAQNKR